MKQYLLSVVFGRFMRNSVKLRNAIVIGFSSVGIGLLPAVLAAEDSARSLQNGPFLRYGTAAIPFIDVALQDSYTSFFEGPLNPEQLAAFALDETLGPDGTTRITEIGWRWQQRGARFEIGYSSDTLTGRLEEGLGLFVDPVEVRLKYRRLRLEGRLESPGFEIGQLALTAGAGIGVENYKVSSSLQSALLDIQTTSETRVNYAVLGLAAELDLLRLQTDLRWGSDHDRLWQVGLGIAF